MTNLKSVNENGIMARNISAWSVYTITHVGWIAVKMQQFCPNFELSSMSHGTSCWTYLLTASITIMNNNGQYEYTGWNATNMLHVCTASLNSLEQLQFVPSQIINLPQKTSAQFLSTVCNPPFSDFSCDSTSLSNIPPMSRSGMQPLYHNNKSMKR